MEGVLPGYDTNPATWLYLSLPLLVAVFFRFGRIWSLRNLDLLLVLALSPGLLLIRERPGLGYSWLFTVTGLLLVRLFCDGILQRRPRLDPNLNLQGMGFLGVAAFAFLMTIVATREPSLPAMETVNRGQDLLNRVDSSAVRSESDAGPASSLLATPVAPLTEPGLAARVLTIVAHLAAVAGLVFLGYRHFGDLHVGLGMATLYLLLPCTAFDVDKVNHVLPAALIVWAFAAYRRPMVAGGLMGLACGTLFFPVFLLPLWAAFYDRRGALRFASALAIVGAVLLGCLARTSADPQSFAMQTYGSIDWSVLTFHGGQASGFWTTYNAAYRIPVFVAFLVMLIVLTVWPRTKTLEHLMAHSTAIIVGIQFWYPQQGGEYLLWFLPLLLLVIFRPRLVHLLPPDLSRMESADRENGQPAVTPRERTMNGVPNGARLFR